MSIIQSLRSRLLLAALSLGLCALSIPTSAQAATSAACTNGGFTITLPSGQVLSAKSGYKISRSALPTNSLVRVRGRYIEFDLNVSTFAVYNYTLTGASNPLDITGGVRTVLFTRKEPNLGGQKVDAGDFEVTLSAPDLEFRRQGSALKMKIQAKDCAQGGIFQMEPETNSGADVVITHTLASPGIFYFTNPYTGKVNFGNSDLIRGKDSPQVAAKLSQNEFETVWSVASGGRMGGVLGEDAIESSPPATACVQDCQAQNRIHGSVPVLDPVYESDGGED
ncbi:hypothetical protein [Vitiosangium sp. GDMCC 1.1324]|uniref:hypothetical protein n=1 Tax=Vitiosangium sp. (strain GDMCC 1.1324) TaxID=2138576 RepID=UPI000D3A959F|nr:hypothetical protein [Vitiosangium sp. GDMCC 1.1324]PTL76011.1 hypothetical protein DAT35_51735 [Vitiosangium sp. GDMCC 1.1324]